MSALRNLWLLVVLTVPLLGVWIASSVAAHANGPRWLVVGAGALLFPILPLAWELRSKAKRLGFLDRLALRTLALNLVFLAALLYWSPARVFTALSARGDWMLFDARGKTAEALRALVFRAADGVEWVYLAAAESRYRGDAPPPPRPRPKPDPAATDAARSDGLIAALVADVADVTDVADPVEPVEAPRWPFDPAPHPLAASIPADSLRSPAAVAKYLVGREPEPTRQLRAIHDFVATHLVYDYAALDTAQLPPQSADAVLASGRAVCAGYANLFAAIAAEAGFPAAFISGRIRGEDNDLDGTAHAWNAVELDGRWQLVDVTWDSPHAQRVNGVRGAGTLRADYFLTPPEVFGGDHFPDDPKWQLLERPLSRGEFIRAPALTPAFFASGARLLAPTRSAVDAVERFEIEIANPEGRSFLARIADRGCEARREGETTRLSCALGDEGVARVRLYMNERPEGEHAGVGFFLVTKS